VDNKMPWIIAGIFGLFVAGAIVWVVFFPQPTPPNSETTRAGMLTIQRPAEPITLILPAAPSGGADAGDHYAAAIKARQDYRKPINDVIAHMRDIMATPPKYTLTDADLALLKRVADPIAAGAAQAKMTYYFRLTPKEMAPPFNPAAALAFQEIADVPMVLTYQHVANGAAEYPQAEKRLFELLTIGYHLMAERARLDIVRCGLGLQGAACDLLEQLYGKWDKPDRRKQVQAYRRGLLEMRGVYSDLKMVTRKLVKHEGALTLHPGNIFNLAENHADRCVRVEAIIGLGMVKMTCTGRGDRRYAWKLIRKYLADGDPIEQAAARVAEAMDQKVLDRWTSQ